MVNTSCEDFLTITPTSSIVEEEFWEDRNDLENAVYACYKKMTNSSVLNSIIYWGEMRSDNFDRSANTTSTSAIANIMNANLLPTYGQFNWTELYKTINYCNKVISHGPQVVVSDESFSEGDWIPIHAEMVALRALSHFYLVRAFGEIPYVTTDFNNDSQELRQTQCTQLQVLDSIIIDLESVKDKAMNDYGKTVLNKGRFTKKGVYALLADVYLWRASYKAGNCHPFINRMVPTYNVLYKNGKVPNSKEEYGTSAEYDYQKCIECCDKVISIAEQEMTDYLNMHGYNVGGSTIEIGLGDLLAQNVKPNKSIMPVTSSAYTTVFGTGNSNESILELQFDGTTYGNGMITDLFYNIAESKVGSLAGSGALFEAALDNPNTESPTALYTKTDYRRWENIRWGTSLTSYDLRKFVLSSVSQSNNATSLGLQDNSVSDADKITVNQSMRTKNNVNANFPLYRISDIYLIKAEAMSQVYTSAENDKPVNENQLYQAFRYVREVFKRSNPIAYAGEYSLVNNSGTKANDSLKFELFKTPEALENLIMAERQREFLCEGKRWFDLVRYAQRHGGTEKMLNFLVRKYDASKQKGVKAKLADMQSLFCPVHENELKNNTWLYQNGVWEQNSSSGRTDNI